MRGVKKPSARWGWLVVLSAAAGAAQAQAPGSAGTYPAVQPVEQAARDTERVRILQDELAREQQQLAEAAKRRAERVAARDEAGTRDAEAAQQRASANIAALRREIDAAGRSARDATPAQPAAALNGASGRRPAASRATAEPARAAAWWDVYGKPPRRSEPPAQQASAAADPAPATGERAW